MTLRNTTYVGFKFGTWVPSRRTEVDAVATLQIGLNGFDWDLPSRRAPRGLTGNTLHPTVLDRTVFEWFFNTRMFSRHVFGVDAPFGWPVGFRSFMDGVMPNPMPEMGDLVENPILYRECDRLAFDLLGVEPVPMLDQGDSIAKAQTVIRILQQRVGAHVGFVGRTERGSWCDLDTIIIETDPVCADWNPAFKKVRRSLFAQINRSLQEQGKPRLKTVEKSALSSALIAMGTDQAICDPVDSDTLYFTPSGLFAHGDAWRGSWDAKRDRTESFVSRDQVEIDLDGKSSKWPYDASKYQTEGFPMYPVSTKAFVKWKKLLNE